VRPYLLAVLLLTSLASACVTGADDSDHVQVQPVLGGDLGGTPSCSFSTCHGDAPRGGSAALHDDAADLITGTTCSRSGCHQEPRSGGELFVHGGDDLDECPHLELHDALLAGDDTSLVNGGNDRLGLQCDHCHDTDD